jgi:hypothetical protein
MPSVSSVKSKVVAKNFSMTSLDKEILPRAVNNIDLWLNGYFDGQAFPYQRHFYHRPQKNKLCVAGIRTGKSRLASFGFLHYAQYHPFSRLLNTSISSEQAKIVFQNCLEYCNAPRFKHWVEHIQSSPYPLIRLVNGAELWFRSIGYEAELIRGFEFDLINIDEASYVTRESAYKTLRGRLLGINPLTHLPRAGIMWLITSPKGQGWIAELWKKGDPQFVNAQPAKYLSMRATIWDNPLLDQDQINDLMADYTDAMIRQELYGEFLSSTDAIFPYTQVMLACDAEDYQVRWIYDQIVFWNRTRGQQETTRKDMGLTEDINHYECEPQIGHRYVNSWDLGKVTTKKGRNAMVGMVFDITHEPWTLVAYFYRENMGYVEAKGVMEQWHQKYSYSGSVCQTVMDSTGKGDVLEEFIIMDKTIRDLEGIVYSSANKPNLIHAGQIMLERGNVRFPFIRRLVDQLTNYEIYDKEIAQDLVMCYCQAMYKARDMTRLTPSTHVSLQRTLNAMPQYGQRVPQIRMNQRFVEGRLSRRSSRQIGGNRRGSSGTRLSS